MLRSKVFAAAAALALPAASIAAWPASAGAVHAASAPTISSISVFTPLFGGSPTPLNGGKVIPYGAGFVIGGGSLPSINCAESDATVTITGTNLSASDTVAVSGYNGPLGVFSPKTCNVTSTSSTRLTFTVGTAAALPTPAGYAAGKTVPGTISVKAPGGGSASYKTSFGSFCGSFPAANAPGTTVGDEGGPNSVWADITLLGGGKNHDFIISLLGTSENLGPVVQPFCTADLGASTSPDWADNFPVQVSQATFNAGSTASARGQKKPPLTSGTITGASFSFPYAESLDLTVNKLVSTWTIKAPTTVSATGCKVTAVAGAGSTSGTSCSLKGDTVKVTNTNATAYTDGDNITAPTIELTGVTGPVGAKVQLVVGSSTANITIDGLSLTVVFAPRAGTANATYTTPNGTVTLTAV